MSEIKQSLLLHCLAVSTPGLDPHQSRHFSYYLILSSQSLKWYSIDAQDVLIVKIPILRQLVRPHLIYKGTKLLPGWLDSARFWLLKPSLKARI